MKSRSAVLALSLALLAACGESPTRGEASPPVQRRADVIPMAESSGKGAFYRGDWTGVAPVDFGVATSLRVWVTGVVTGNPNEQALNLLASPTCAAPWTVIHTFTVGDPTPSAPYVAHVGGQVVDGAVRCLALDGGDGFEGDVFLWAEQE